jgi:hypothetical protein
VIQKFDLFVPQFVLFVLQSTLPIFQIKALSDSLLYIELVVAFLMSLLTIVHLFVDRLFFALGTTTLLSFVIIVVTTNLM